MPTNSVDIRCGGHGPPYSAALHSASRNMSSALRSRAYLDLLNTIAAVKGRLIYARLWSTAGVVAVWAVAAVLIPCLLDNVLHLPATARAVLGPAILLALLACSAYWIIKVHLAKHSDDDAALAIEERFPELQTRVINAVQVGRQADAGDSPFAAALVEESVTQMRQHDLGQTVDKTAVRRRLGMGAAALVTMFAYVFCCNAHFVNATRRFLSPRDYVAPVGLPTLNVTPGDCTLAVGDDLTVKVAIDGKFEPPVQLLRGTGDDGWEKMEMFGAGEAAFELPFKDVRDSFPYRVATARTASPVFTVAVADPPAITVVNVEYHYPAYTDLDVRKCPDCKGDIRALAGTKVKLEAKATRPLGRATFVRDHGEDCSVTIRDRVWMETQFIVERSGSYTLHIADQDGLKNPEPMTRSIIAEPDGPPAIQIASPAQEVKAKKDEVVKIEIAVADEYGVADCELRYRKGEGDECSLNRWKFAPVRASASPTYSLSLGDLELSPGDAVTYWATAADANTLTGPGRSQTEEHVIHITDTDLERQEDIAGLSAGQDSLVSILTRQKRNATQTGELVELLTPGQPFTKRSKRDLTYVKSEQSKIRTDTLGLAKGLPKSHAAVSEGLAALATDEMTAAVHQLEAAVSAPVANRPLKRGKTQEAEATQKEIIERLEAMLGQAEMAERAAKVHDVVRGLDEAIGAQQKIRNETAKPGAQLERLASDQDDVRDRMEALTKKLPVLAEEFDKSDPILAKAFTKLAADTREQKLPELMKQIRNHLDLSEPNEAAAKQDEALSRLKKNAGDLQKALLDNAERKHKKLNDAVAEAVENGRKMLKLEKRIQQEIQELDKMGKDTYSPEEEQKFSKLTEYQQRIEDACKDAAKDLKLLHKHDFTSGLAEEFTEIREHVEASKEALAKKATTKAMEPTQKIIDELEKVCEQPPEADPRLGNSPDRSKQELKPIAPEDCPEELPLGKLPEKLQDIIGNLLEKQEDQQEDVDDMTTNWVVKENEGGKPEEGSKSSYSARGKTGNQQPNSSEISGRSGAGRQGKSSGELVEPETKNIQDDSATPQRITRDPVQAGSVEDKALERESGGTGGGKSGGAGDVGLPGEADTKLDKEMKELARRQRSTRTSSEQLQNALNTLYVPAGHLPQAISLMRDAEGCLECYDLAGASQKQKAAVEVLRKTYREMTGKPYVRSGDISALPKELQRQIRQAKDEKFAPGYEALLQNYYKQISNAGSTGK